MCISCSLMTYSFYSMKEYLEAFEKDPSLVGPSPGGAIGAMRCSRQYVHQLEKEGKIDTVRVYQKGRWWGKELIVFMITEKSLARYLKERYPDIYDPKHPTYRPPYKAPK